MHTSTRDTPETFRALNGGLGLMGAITELVLQLTPPTNTALKTLMNQPDDQIYDVIKQLLVVGVFFGWGVILCVCEGGVCVCVLGCVLECVLGVAQSCVERRGDSGWPGLLVRSPRPR